MTGARFGSGSIGGGGGHNPDLRRAPYPWTYNGHLNPLNKKMKSKLWPSVVLMCLKFLIFAFIPV